MAVAMIVDNPEGSQEAYERIRALLGVEQPAGGICHLAGPAPDGGWRVIEVWESEEDAQRFAKERLAPAAEAVGTPPPPSPTLWPLHSYLV
jgi:hypothetical protein